jgi:hypothetical protein
MFSWSCSPYIDVLATAGATISMEGRSRPCDNTFVSDYGTASNTRRSIKA